MFIPQICGKKHNFWSHCHLNLDWPLQTVVSLWGLWDGQFEAPAPVAMPMENRKILGKKVEKKKKNVFFHIFDQCFLVLGFFVNWESIRWQWRGFTVPFSSHCYGIFSVRLVRAVLLRVNGHIRCWLRTLLRRFATKWIVPFFGGRRPEDAQIIQKLFH